MKEIFIILGSLPLYVINAFCDKHVSTKTGRCLPFFYNALKFLLGSLFFLPLFIADSALKFEWGVILMGVICGILFALSKTLIMKGYEKTSVAFMSLCHASGMIIPCIIGHFFWDEHLSVWSVIGILLAVFSVFLLKSGEKGGKGYQLSGIIIGIIVFISSGGVMITQKVMPKYFPDQSVGAYNFYSFLVAFIILLFFSQPQKEVLPRAKSVFPFAIGSAVSLCLVSFIMTKLAGSVPSVILFPLFNGLGIILVCIGSVFLFKEKMTPKKIIGMAIGILGLCLVNI